MMFLSTARHMNSQQNQCDIVASWALPWVTVYSANALNVTRWKKHSPFHIIFSQVGGIKPGCLKIGNTGGMMDNILSSKLYRPGSVAYVSRSGGMSNELNNIISHNTDGVFEGVAIGGDRWALQTGTCSNYSLRDSSLLSHDATVSFYFPLLLWFNHPATYGAICFNVSTWWSEKDIEWKSTTPF